MQRRRQAFQQILNLYLLRSRLNSEDCQSAIPNSRSVSKEVKLRLYSFVLAFVPWTLRRDEGMETGLKPGKSIARYSFQEPSKMGHLQTPSTWVLIIAPKGSQIDPCSCCGCSAILQANQPHDNSQNRGKTHGKSNNPLPCSDACNMAVGQNQWYHFGIGARPILVNFSGDWDVHWGVSFVAGFERQPHFCGSALERRGLRSPRLARAHAMPCDGLAPTPVTYCRAVGACETGAGPRKRSSLRKRDINAGKDALSKSP